MVDHAGIHVSLGDLLRLRAKASGFSFLPRQPIHSVLAGRHGSRLRGRGLEFLELRHYAEGDDVRTIDWSATARQREPFVRVYTEERDRPVLLVIDQRLSMFFGSSRVMKSVAAAEVAALSAFRVTSLGDRVGAVVFSENGIDEIRPAARDGAVWQVLNAVAEHNGLLSADDARQADPALLNAAVRIAGRLLPHDGLVCLITDAFGADAETVELVTRITAHNDVLVAFISDVLERDLPDIGQATVAQGNLRLEVDLSSRALRRRFAASFDDRLTAVQRFSRQRAIPVLPITTDRETAVQLREVLGQRLDRRRAG